MTQCQLNVVTMFASQSDFGLTLKEFVQKTGWGSWTRLQYASAAGYLIRMVQAGLLEDLGKINGERSFVLSKEGKLEWIDNGCPIRGVNGEIEFTRKAA